MKLSSIAFLLVTACFAVRCQQATPTMASTDTPNGRKGDVVSISGENLQKELVAKVLLTDGQNDFPVEVTEQTSTMVKFRIPDKVTAGRLGLMVLTTGKASPKEYIFLPRFKITVDQRGNFQVDDTYRRKAVDRDQALKWLQEQNDIAMGKGERTLALIQDVTSWFKLDSTSREAVAKSRQLREFYASFLEEYSKLLQICEANAALLKTEDAMLLQEAKKESDEIESKMRRLKAMGFEEQSASDDGSTTRPAVRESESPKHLESAEPSKPGPKLGAVSGRLFAITGGGDVKPARMAKVYLLSWEGGQASAANVFANERHKANMEYLKELRAGKYRNESLSCQKELVIYDEAILGTLRWAESQKKTAEIQILQADEDGSFKTADVEPGLYSLLAFGRAGLNEGRWVSSDVRVEPGAETSLKLSGPEKACLVLK